MTNTTANTAKICEPGSESTGLFLPIFEGENDGSKGLRAVIYGTLLFYCFLGVNIIADAFMSAIETVTGAKKRVFNKTTGRYVTVTVWNDTVKNLTLLALGSSAPEILLSIIEIMSNEFFSGELGPSTIVGSAAFNLFCIIAVCIVAIESPETRYIKEQTVYNITAIFSMVAYFWLLMIVSVISPNIIGIEEALITLLLFPLLVVISFLADIGYFSNDKKELSLDSEEKKKALLHPQARVSAKKAEALAARTSKRLSQEKIILMDSVDTENGGKIEKAAQTLPFGDDGEGIRKTDGCRSLIVNPRGVLTFCNDSLDVLNDGSEKRLAVPVLRKNGSSGVVSCKCRTEKWSALPQYHYEEIKQDLVFEDGVEKQEIIIKILPSQPKKRSDRFQVILDEVEGGAQFNPNDDGGEELGRLTVNLCQKREASSFADRCQIACCMDRDVGDLGMKQWWQQIQDALSVSAGNDDEDGGEDSKPSVTDYVMHVLSFPWKIFFAVFAPPPIFAGGWLLFFTALVHIGVVTALIADFASFFGCCLHVSNSVTAITIVALGTSLPDLFASKAAACDDDYADASIVNVTGSNSVNVFLGIGFPWTIAAIYWKVQGCATDDWKERYGDKYLSDHPDGAFVVEAGSLGFSVTIFSCCALIALLSLRIKRLLLGGELGGPAMIKFGVGAIFVFLWLIYIVFSIIRDGGDGIDMPGKVIAMVLAGLVLIAAVVVEVGCRNGSIPVAELQGKKRKSSASSANGKIEKVPLKNAGDIVPAYNGSNLSVPDKIQDSESSSVDTSSNKHELSPKTCGKSSGDDKLGKQGSKSMPTSTFSPKMKAAKAKSKKVGKSRGSPSAPAPASQTPGVAGKKARSTQA